MLYLLFSFDETGLGVRDRTGVLGCYYVFGLAFGIYKGNRVCAVAQLLVLFAHLFCIFNLACNLYANSKRHHRKSNIYACWLVFSVILPIAVWWVRLHIRN
jgi:hypothetical protein